MTQGKLTLIGLGLYSEKDVSIKGLEQIKSCNKVFAEFYTSKLIGTTIENIEKTIGKKIQVLSRKETEKADTIINAAKKGHVCFLTAGDPMTATTHIDLRIRAEKQDILTKVIHSSTVISAVPGILGLQNYKFGRTTTLAYPEGDYFPTSPLDVIADNQKIGLHTLVLLDIQEDKNRYMTANEGLKFLLEMEKKVGKKIISKESLVCVVARAGSDDAVVRADEVKNLLDFDFGSPLHSLVVPGKLHFMEIEALEVFAQLPAQQMKKLQKI